MFQSELYNGITNVIVWQLLRERLNLNYHSLNAFQCKSFRNTRHTVHLVYHCKALFETPCIRTMKEEIENVSLLVVTPLCLGSSGLESNLLASLSCMGRVVISSGPIS
jgi:hypothetical protein